MEDGSNLCLEVEGITQAFFFFLKNLDGLLYFVKEVSGEASSFMF